MSSFLTAGNILGASSLPAVTAPPAGSGVSGLAGIASIAGGPVTMGIEAGGLALGAVTNLLACGTLTQLGCTKRKNTAVQNAAVTAAIQAVYLALDGGNPAGGYQQLEAAAQQFGSQNLAAIIGFGGYCNPAGAPPLPIPQTSKAAAALCGTCFTSCSATAGTLHQQMSMQQFFAFCAQIIQGAGGASGAGGTAGTPNSAFGSFALPGAAAPASSTGKTIGIAAGIGGALLLAAHFL